MNTVKLWKKLAVELSRLTMQAYTSPYVCPYFTCSSPYCLALRSSAVAASSLSVNRPPTSPSQPGISSFTISSILSRSEEQTNKAARAEETIVSKSLSEGSLSQFAPYSSHVSVERFHPYHRPLTASAFARTTCNALQKGECTPAWGIVSVDSIFSRFVETIFSRFQLTFWNLNDIFPHFAVNVLSKNKLHLNSGLFLPGT